MQDLTRSEARIEHLKRREQEFGTGNVHVVRLGGKEVPLPVFRVTYDTPKYRLENGRIKSRVMKLQSDPATKKVLEHPTSNAAQDLLERELLALAQEANLYNIIKRTGYQAEPLLLTYDGIVVNGNRRLAILKELKVGDGYVEVCRLPQSTEPEEIQLIELTLQMDNPGKADYSWINQLLTIRENLEMGLTRSQIRDAMPGQTDADVRKLIETISLVDAFLERQGTPGDYSSIGEDKYFFDELAKGVKKYRNSPDKRDALLWGAVNYYKSSPRDSTEDRSYLKLKKLSRHIDEVVEAFRDSETTPGASQDPKDPLARVSSQASAFQNKKIASELSDTIHSVVLDAVEREQRNKDNSAIFNDLEQFARKIAAAEPDNRTAKVAGILEQIANIEGELMRIKSWAEKQIKS